MKMTQREEDLAAEWIKNRDPQRPSFAWTIQHAQDPQLVGKDQLAEAFIAGLRATQQDEQLSQKGGK
jgi:hypothetical protein